MEVQGLAVGNKGSSCPQPFLALTKSTEIPVRPKCHTCSNTAHCRLPEVMFRRALHPRWVSITQENKHWASARPGRKHHHNPKQLPWLLHYKIIPSTGYRSKHLPRVWILVIMSQGAQWTHCMFCIFSDSTFPSQITVSCSVLPLTASSAKGKQCVCNDGWDPYALSQDGQYTQIKRG